MLLFYKPEHCLVFSMVYFTYNWEGYHGTW